MTDTAKGLTQEDFARLYPRVYHMAEAGSWENIRAQGLRSTLALLDLYEVAGTRRENLLSTRRTKSEVLESSKYPKATIRDNLPILDSQLQTSLRDGLQPDQWYRILNERVFFWVSEQRLSTLLGARAYRNRPHDVLTVDTRSLLAAHGDAVTLSPINSGATIPGNMPRGLDTFLPFVDYPYQYWLKKRGSKGQPVVELAINYMVHDIAEHTVTVDRRMAGQQSSRIWPMAE